MRLHGDVALFTAYFDNVLSRVNSEKKTCYISGDYNINLLKCDTHISTSDFANCIFSHSFLPPVNKPTRITDYTATLIDNIITNASLVNSISAIICADISEHFPVFLQTSSAVKPTVKPRFIYKHNFSEKKKIS